MRRATRPPAIINLIIREFLSTLSLRRATVIGQRIGIRIDNFYPRSPCGERQANNRTEQQAQHEFLSTLSLRRATITLQYAHNFATLFLSTLSLRRATYNLNLPSKPIERFLSTLSLRRATRYHTSHTMTACISIHALLAESDVFSICLQIPEALFLSTLSLRRATALV